MRRGMYVAATVACAVVAAGALGGCEGDGGDPAPSPSESASSSAPPATPSTSTSPSPEAETAEEFIRRWVEVQTAMQNSGDTAEFRTISTGCKPCTGLADQVDEIYAAGGFVETDGWTVTAFKKRVRRGEQTIVRAEIDNAATRYSEEAGGPVRTLRAGNGLIEFTVRPRGDSFRMKSLVEISTP